MLYNIQFWNKYTENNKTGYNEEFSKFVCELVFSLRANNVLEVGCNVGNDLRVFPETFDVNGVDLNEYALEIARKKLPSFKFKKASIDNLPYEDSSMDLVFTHNVLNYIPNEDIQKAMNELLRVSRNYIVNFELFSENEEMLNKHPACVSWYRNMYRLWMNFPVKIISNVDMHEEYDPLKTRFTLVKKIKL